MRGHDAVTLQLTLIGVSHLFLSAITVSIVLATPLANIYAQVAPITFSGLNTQICGPIAVEETRRYVFTDTLSPIAALMSKEDVMAIATAAAVDLTRTTNIPMPLKGDVVISWDTNNQEILGFDVRIGRAKGV